MSRVLRLKIPDADYEVRILGGRRAPLRDFYHALLRLPWWVTVVAITTVFLGANALFAVAYLLTGGVAHAASGSFTDAFFFSVQTMGTIGYGAMYPETPTANLLVVAESITGLTLTALVTGLVFSKFSRSTARVSFTREAAVTLVNGRPTLTFRMGNERGNRIVDAQIRVVMVRTERLAEGPIFYRMLDLELTRGRALSLQRSWSVLHTIDEKSPLAGETPESMAEKEAELQVMIVGLDDITMQPVHASHTYYARQILWGSRHVDVLTEASDGALVLDLRKFHDTEVTQPSAEFPYPRDLDTSRGG